MNPHAAFRRYDAAPGSHRHDYVQLLFCTAGALALEVDGHAAQLAPGAGYVIPEGARHDFAGRNGNACVVLDLPWPEADGALAPLLTRPTTVALAAADWPLLRYLADELEAAPDDPLLQHAAPTLLLRLLARQAPAPGRARALPFATLTDYIDARLTQPLSNAVLAARCCLSVAQFQARFLDEVGCTPQAYVRSRRLERALALLDEGLPVAVVAAGVGYASPSALTAALRRERGVTARGWRGRG